MVKLGYGVLRVNVEGDGSGNSGGKGNVIDVGKGLAGNMEAISLVIDEIGGLETVGSRLGVKSNQRGFWVGANGD